MRDFGCSICKKITRNYKYSENGRRIICNNCYNKDICLSIKKQKQYFIIITLLFLIALIIFKLN